jgi:hypothetical protein
VQCYVIAVSDESDEFNVLVARSTLFKLLGEDRGRLVDALMEAAYDATMNVKWGGDWRGPKMRLVRLSAQKLDKAIAALPFITRAMLTNALNDETHRSFLPERVRAVPVSETGEWYADCFCDQLKYLASADLVSKRAVGRQRELDRDRLATRVARMFRDAGLKPTNYEKGTFGQVLRVILRLAGFAVPSSTYLLIHKAIVASKLPVKLPTSRS